MANLWNTVTNRVMRLANREADRFRHEYLGTEHLLMALLRDPDCAAAKALATRGLDLRHVRLLVERDVHTAPANNPVPTTRPLTPRGRFVLRLAAEEADALGRADVDTGALLLGLLRETGGVASQVLRGLGCGDLRDAVAGFADPVRPAGPEVDYEEVAPLPPEPPGEEEPSLEEMGLLEPLPPVEATPLPSFAKDLRTALNRVTVGGAAGGLLTSLPISLLLALLVFDPQRQPGWFVTAMGFVVAVWVGLVAAAGAVLLAERPMDEKHRALVWKRVGLWVLGSLGLGAAVGVALTLFWGTLPAALALVILVGAGAVLGRARGLQEVHALESEADRQAFETLSRLEQNAELTRRLERRFGRRGDAIRQRVEGWDNDQLTDAARRLGDARSLRDLGLADD